MSRIACPRLYDALMQVDVNGTRLWFDVDGQALEVIDGAGHFPWKDAPERYWPLLESFIASCQAAAGRVSDKYPGEDW